MSRRATPPNQPKNACARASEPNKSPTARENASHQNVKKIGVINKATPTSRLKRLKHAYALLQGSGGSSTSS